MPRKKWPDMFFRLLPAFAITIGVGFFASMRPALADGPVAIVEDVHSSTAGVEFMDYLTQGQIIDLGPADTLVLGYMSSCWIETITGGTVTIGLARSDVANGRVQRKKIRCHGGRIDIATHEMSKSAVAVFRGTLDKPSTPEPSSKAPPELTIYASSPIIDLGAAGRLVIERLDRAEPRVAIDITDQMLLHRTFYDFADMDRSLAPGGTYRLSFGGRTIVLKIDLGAPREAPIIARLIRLPPSD